MTSVATHALRACSSLGALCSFKPCTIISQLANLPSPILLQAIIIFSIQKFFTRVINNLFLQFAKKHK